MLSIAVWKLFLKICLTQAICIAYSRYIYTIFLVGIGDPLRTYTYKYAANLVHMVADLRGDAQGRSFPLEVSMVAKPKDL